MVITLSKMTLEKTQTEGKKKSRKEIVKKGGKTFTFSMDLGLDASGFTFFIHPMFMRGVAKSRP